MKAVSYTHLDVYKRQGSLRLSVLRGSVLHHSGGLRLCTALVDGLGFCVDVIRALPHLSLIHIFMCATSLGKLCASDHAMNAIDEMSALNRDIKRFFDCLLYTSRCV